MSKRHVANLTEEQIALNKEWIKELRSGKHKQGKTALCRINADGDKLYCCLGIAVDLVLKIEGVKRVIGWLEFDGEESILSEEAQQRLGLISPIGATYQRKLNEENRSLSALNDSYNYTFGMIADAIEESLQYDSVEI